MTMELSGLMQMDRAALIAHWQAVFGVPPPLKCREELLRQALGWKLQASVQGGLTGMQKRALRHSASPVLQPGSRLIRVWQGETHQVTVLENGYSYDGRQWRSLSAIARAITGTPWSGPVFFGIRK